MAAKLLATIPWRRVLGAIFLGVLIGGQVDVVCQVLAQGGAAEHVSPPVLGWIAGPLVMYALWPLLDRFQMRGWLHKAGWGCLAGVLLGAFLGAALLTPLLLAYGPTPPQGTPPEEVAMIFRVFAVFAGIIVGGLLGLAGGLIIHFLKRPHAPS